MGTSAPASTPKVFTTNPKPSQKKVKTTPGAIGKRIYDEWEKTSTQNNPRGNQKLWDQLNKYIENNKGFNKAGLSEYREKIQTIRNLPKS